MSSLVSHGFKRLYLSAKAYSVALQTEMRSENLLVIKYSGMKIRKHRTQMKYKKSNVKREEGSCTNLLYSSSKKHVILVPQPKHVSPTLQSRHNQ